MVGIRPFKSIAKVGAGAKKLITLPLNEMKKEQGNLASGLGKGAKEFLHAVSLEVLQLGANIAGFSENLALGGTGSGTQPGGPVEAEAGAEGRHGAMAGAAGASTTTSSSSSLAAAAQPADIRQGLQQASTRLSSGIQAALLLTNDDTYSHRLLTDAGATAGAIKCTLLGARNQLDPERYFNNIKSEL